MDFDAALIELWLRFHHIKRSGKLSSLPPSSRSTDTAFESF